jgi:hypothetical protein
MERSDLHQIGDQNIFKWHFRKYGYEILIYRQIYKIPNLFSPLEPTGYVMHQQFNIQQLYALPTLYLCVLYLSEHKQRLVPLTA